MKREVFVKKFLLALIAAMAFCTPAWAGEITVAAGAGLKDVLNELAADFVKKNPSMKIVRNFVVSGVLAKQLDSGAHADIVFTANREWMDYLRKKRHVDDQSVKPFAYNTLVFVGKGAPAASRMADLPKLARIAVASPRSVPAGEYAVEAIRNAGLEKWLEKKLVMARDVRECLMYAERGEVDGAFVYSTDALLSQVVAVWFTVPQELYSRVVYLSALTGSGAKNREAAAFYAFLYSGEARKILLKYAFEVR